MSREGCLRELIVLSVIVAPVPLFIFVTSGLSMIYDWIIQRGSFPLPSLAPAFFFGSLFALLPLALLWGLYFFVSKKSKADPTE